MKPEARDVIATILRRFHRNSCYPEAMDFEIDIAVTSIIEALSEKRTQNSDGDFWGEPVGPPTDKPVPGVDDHEKP